MTTTTTTDGPTWLRLDEITIGDNVRGADLGDLDGLARSIAAVGLLNPLTVRLLTTGEGWELVAGHRRYQALRQLDHKTAQCQIVETAGAGERLAIQLVENLQREDLAPVAEARGLAELVELLGGRRQAAAAVGCSPGHVTKRLALLRLPEPVQEAVDAGEIGPADAYELSRVKTAKNVRRLATRLLEAADPDNYTSAAHVRTEVARAINNEAEDKRLRKIAKDLDTERAEPDPAIIAGVDAPEGRYLDGWDGLPVDYDAHRAEPCHLQVLMSANQDGTPAHWRDLCTDPDRHGPDGDSDVKLIASDAAEERKMRTAKLAAEREAREAAQAERNAKRVEAVRIAAKGLTRSGALDVLTAAWVGALTETGEDNEFWRFLADLIGVPLPPSDAPEDNGVAWGELPAWLANLEGAKAWRAAAGAALYWSALYEWRANNEAVLAAGGYVAPETDEPKEDQ